MFAVVLEAFVLFSLMGLVREPQDTEPSEPCSVVPPTQPRPLQGMFAYRMASCPPPGCARMCVLGNTRCIILDC